ncbi:MAG: response regulator [Lachnospiraceae bacterium]|nr:response regulator [Lachnospiraceae bacterium]
MSKIESGKLELNAVSTNSRDFLNDIASVFYELARMKGIRLTTDFSDLKTVWVEMDSLRARQVYANLLNNAIKFSEAGTVINWTITDTILDDYRTERVVVIEDQGRGMSQKFMKTMFDPFEQEEDEEIPNDESGTGLGLSIVRNILDLTGSKIDVQSEIGKGTKFTITIIRKHGTPIVQENKENEEKENLCEGKRLLLFEDHPLNRQIMSKILEKKNIIVEEATNGKEGVDMFIAANEGYYDVIFMDISMPIMNGYEATKAIRSLEREDAKNVPIIAITANAFTDDVEKCIECGMNQHISKPIDVNRVYAVLEEVLRK